MATNTTDIFSTTAMQINSLKLMIACINQDLREQIRNMEKQHKEITKMKGHLMSAEARIAAVEKSLKILKKEFDREEAMLSDLGNTSKNEELLFMAEMEESEEPRPGPSSATD